VSIVRGVSHYAVGAVLVRLADEGARLALVLLAIDRTGSARVGGALVAALLVPQVVAAPGVGLLTDRVSSPRWVIATAALGFATALVGVAVGLGRAPLALIFVALVTGGCCGPALTGALTSQLPGLVQDSSLPRAFGIDSLTYNVSGIVGPALVAGLSSFASPAIAMGALGACAATGGVVLAGLPLDGRVRSAQSVDGWPQLTEALRLVVRDRVLGPVTAATTVGQLGLGGLPVIVVVLARQEHTPAASGWLLTAFAAGGLLGSVTWIWHPAGPAKTPSIVMAALVCTGGPLAVAAGSSALVWTAALFVASGFFTGPLAGALFATRQTHAPDTARAQLFTLGAGLKITASAVGVAAAGALAHVPTATQLLLSAACPFLAGTVGALALRVGHTGGMPRQNRRRRDEPATTDAAAMGRGAVRRETGSDGDWLVRPVTGAAATKSYRCPGCDQEIRPATPHVVAWPDQTQNEADGPGLSDRRHWHTACWQARSRRRPGYWPPKSGH
jgi:MFS family permease